MTPSDPSDDAESFGRTDGGDRTDRTVDGDDSDPDGLPVVDPYEVGPPVREARAHGVVLAAGTGSRFGTGNKLLAALDGRPLVYHAARTLLSADLDGVTAVLGHEAERVRGALSGLPVETVANPDYRDGQATSVRTGVRAARERGADALLVALGDMPRVQPGTVNVLLDAYRAGAGDALAAAVGGRRGNPVLFDARFFDRLAAVSGDTGGRAILLDGDDAALVETGDPGVLRDVDTRADLDRLS
ncbi:nucleotidyltransferase family protein [Halobacteriales archaeon QS_4_69_34]|nr:MAG: nucleotidyltransferase family protein [Halobacteriales archaeon QS_4_69_34]